MSCIVGYIDKKNSCVYMGADSRITSGDHIHNISSNTKVFKPKSNENMIVGIAGILTANQALKYSDIFPSEAHLKETKTSFNTEYITKHLSVEIMEFFKKRKFTNEDLFKIDILIGYKDKLFMIDSEFCCVEIDSNYTAIGSGCDYALGSLFTSKDDFENCVVLKIITALQAGCMSCSVSPPFYIMNTRDDELYTINK